MSVHDPLVLERWRAIFATWRSSGLSVAEFCRSRSQHIHFLPLAEQLRRPRSSSRAPAGPILRARPRGARYDRRVDPPAGVHLRVPLAADAVQVARLVHALGVRPC